MKGTRVIKSAVVAAVVLVLGGWYLRSSSETADRTHTYYIAADETDWDYIPGGKDQITGKAFTQMGYFKDGPHTVPTKYRKALYREYTDSTFKTLKERPAEWAHLGNLGPVLRAEVGDTIRVVFRNNAAHPFGMHPHGVFYNKDSEGALYEDGTSGRDKADDGVPQGGTHVYVWPVPERAGPGKMDPSSIIWMYHSHTDEVKDVNTGLIGPMIVSRRGMTKADGTPKDVDRELVVMFAQTHEEFSWYAQQNLPDFSKNPPQSTPDQIFPWFITFSINGWQRGAMPLEYMTMKTGERVRWYVFASTGDFDFHTPHWHGNTVLIHDMRSDVAALEPMEMLVADMVPDNPGTWFFHCHVSDHMLAGMQTRYAVVPRAGARTASP